MPKTPQQNGIVESMNCTINERVIFMFFHAKLSKSFWGEAMRIVVDLINLFSFNSYELYGFYYVWNGKDFSYDYLRVFGYRAFVHIPRGERSKLDCKTKQYIYIGYGHEEFGNTLFWYPINKNFIRSRDVFLLLLIWRNKKSQRPLIS